MSLIAQDLNDMDMAKREMDNAIAEDMSNMNDASRYYTLYTELLYHNIELNSIFFGHYGNNNE